MARADVVRRRPGACNTQAKELAASEARGIHALELPPAREGACSIRRERSWRGYDRRHWICMVDWQPS